MSKQFLDRTVIWGSSYRRAGTFSDWPSFGENSHLLTTRAKRGGDKLTKRVKRPCQRQVFTGKKRG